MTLVKLPGYYKLEKSNFALLNQLMARYLENISKRGTKQRYSLYLKKLSKYLKKNSATLLIPIYQTKIKIDGQIFDFKDAPMEFTILNFIHNYLSDERETNFEDYLKKHNRE